LERNFNKNKTDFASHYMNVIESTIKEDHGRSRQNYKPFTLINKEIIDRVENKLMRGNGKAGASSG